MTEDPSADRGIEALSTAEELQLKENAMDGAPVGITISDPARPDNPLIYVNDSFVELTGYPREDILGTNCRFLQGEETDPELVDEMREAIEAAEPVAVELVNYTRDGERFWNRVEIAPIRDEAGEVTNFVGYQADVTDRKEAELALEVEREALDHVLSRVTTLVPDITDAIVRARSREGLETALVDRFAAVPDFAAAWLGRYNPSTSRLTPVAGADGPEAALLATADAPYADRLDTAARDGTVEVLVDSSALSGLFDTPVGEGSEREAGTPASQDAPVPLGAAALIPLQYRQTVYGLLAVGTPDAELFDARETAVLGALGRAAGAAINALESDSLEAGESVIEVRLEITDRTMPLVRLAERLGSEITVEGQPRVADGEVTLLLTLADVSKERLQEPGEEGRESVRLVAERDDGVVVEWTVPDGPLRRTLSDRAVRLGGLSATASGVRLRVEAASEHMANTVVGRFRQAADGVELLALHEVSGTPDTAAAFRESVRESLTPRQLETLQKAFTSGFYAWPRDVEGDGLAAAMDIHPSTFHQHLRAAERKLIGAFFER